MSDVSVTFRFPHQASLRSREVDKNFQDLVAWLVSAITLGSYTISTSADTTGPTGNGFGLLVRDTTAGGTAIVLYEAGQTPTIVSQIAGGGVTYVTAAPGAGEVQIKNNGGSNGVDFRAGTGQDGDVLQTTILYAETA